MKTTAEEKLLNSLEQLVTKARKNMTSREFRKATKEAHEIAQDVIATHKRMIELWTAMDERINGVKSGRLTKK